MASIRLKTRKDGRTAQLVRHVYDPSRKRSRTVTVGSLRLDADPDQLPEGLRYAGEERLDRDALTWLSAWLRQNGNKAAAEARRAIAERARQGLRLELARSASGAGQVCPFEAATEALSGLAALLPSLCEQAGAASWETYRPRYLAVNRSWQRVFNAAQKSGVAVRLTRSKDKEKEKEEEKEEEKGREEHDTDFDANS